MVPLSPGTWARVEMLFAPQWRDSARALLERECADNLPSCERMDMFGLERVRFAVLKLSDGNLEKLRREIEEAKKDWRDSLMAADFGLELKAYEQWWPSGQGKCRKLPELFPTFQASGFCVILPVALYDSSNGNSASSREAGSARPGRSACGD